MKTFKVDLSLPVIDRMKDITEHFSSEFALIKENIDSLYSSIIPMYVDIIIRGITSTFSQTILYKNELIYYSEVLGIDFHKILFMQLFYECISCCTVYVKENKIFRTFDISLPFLKKINYVSEVYRGEEKLYTSVNFYGNVGVFTAFNSEFYASINYRRTKEMNIYNFIINAFRAMTMSWPSSYLLRKVFEEKSSVFILRTAPLISPVYFVICNKLNGQVIVRNSQGCEAFYSERTIYQTNVDPGKEYPNILYSVERNKLCENFTEEELEKLYISPIKNYETIYGCVINLETQEIKFLE